MTSASAAPGPWRAGCAAAVVFLDLDGCLVDSTAAITGSLNRALVDLGLPPREVHELTRFIGPPLTENAATLLAEAGADPALAPTLIRTYRRHYVEVAATQTRVVRGMEEAVDRIRAVSSVVVVTSKPAPFVATILDATGLDGRFAAVHAPILDERGEPKTATLRRALAAVVGPVDPASTVMVGDRHHDVDAGRACGTATVGVTWGAGDRVELEQAGADAIVDTPAALVDLLVPASA